PCPARPRPAGPRPVAKDRPGRPSHLARDAGRPSAVPVLENPGDFLPRVWWWRPAAAIPIIGGDGEWTADPAAGGAERRAPARRASGPARDVARPGRCCGESGRGRV